MGSAVSVKSWCGAVQLQTRKEVGAILCRVESGYVISVCSDAFAA